MATVLESLMLEIGVDVDEKSIQTLNNITEKTVKVLRNVSIAAAGAVAGLVSYTIASSRATDQNAKFADQVGISYEALQELGFAAEREGGSLESVKSSLQGLTTTLGAAALGTGGGIEAFARLGINIRDLEGDLKSADNVIVEVIDRFGSFTKAEQFNLAGQLGISSDLILLMQKGSSNLRELREESRRYGLQSDTLNKSSQKLQDNLTNFAASIKGALFPVLEVVTEALNNIIPPLTNWISANKELINRRLLLFILETTAFLRKLPDVLEKIAPKVLAVVSAFAAFKGLQIGLALAKLTSAIAAIGKAFLLATGPISATGVAIAGVIAGLALFATKTEKGKKAFEEGMKGMDKVVEDLEKSFIGFVNSFGVEVKDLQELWDKYVKPFLEDLASDAITGALDRLKLAIKGISLIFKGWGIIIDSVRDGIKTLVDLVDKVDLSEKFNSFKQGSEDVFKFLAPDWLEDLTIGRQSGSKAVPQSQNQMNSTRNETNNKIDVKIDVNNANGNAGDVGREVNRHIESMLRNGFENSTVRIKM